MKHVCLVSLLLACASSAGRSPTDVPDGDDTPDAAPRADAPARDTAPAHDAPSPHDSAPTDQAAPTDLAALRDGSPDLAAPADAGSAGFGAVQVILARSCIRCHTATPPPRPDSWAYPKLPLTPDVAYRNLVGKSGAETCGGTLVVAGHPERSYLFRKLTDDPPCDGKRMPSPGMLATAPPLPPEDIATIRAWIQAGAAP